MSSNGFLIRFYILFEVRLGSVESYLCTDYCLNSKVEGNFSYFMCGYECLGYIA